MEKKRVYLFFWEVYRVIFGLCFLGSVEGNIWSRKLLNAPIKVGMPRVTQGTSSPRSAVVFAPPDSPGIEFSPWSPPSFPKVPKKEISLQFSYLK